MLCFFCNEKSSGKWKACLFLKKYVVQSFMLHNFVPNHNLSDPIYVFRKICPPHRHHHCRKKCPWHRKKSGKEERKRLEPPPPPHKTELPRTRNTFFVLREKEVCWCRDRLGANVAISLYYRKLPNTEGLKKAFSSSKFRMRENGVASHATDGGGGGGNNFLTSFSLLSWMHTCTKG